MWNKSLQYLTYSELTSINWKQSPGQQWQFSHNTSFLRLDRYTQHPKAGSVSSHHSSSAGTEPTQHSPAGGTLYVRRIITQKKKRKKRIQRQFTGNSIPPCRFHFICQVPQAITIVIFIAGDTWICSKYNNELLYDNYIETMVGK